jgi:hypothetical protein
MFSTTSGSIFSSAQVQGKDRFLPGDLKPLQIEFGQFQKIALGCIRSAGNQHVDVRMPMQEFSVSLDGGDHAGHDIVPTQQASDFRLDAGPRAVSEFAQQLPIEACVDSQTLGNRQDDLPVGDRSADFLGHVQRGQQRPLLVTGGTRTALLAGVGHEHLVAAVGTADASKALFQITAFKKGSYRALDDGPPESVLGLKALVIHLPEEVKMLIDQSPQVGGLGIAWAVEWQRLAAGKSHDQASHPRTTAHDARAPARTRPLVEGPSPNDSNSPV